MIFLKNTNFPLGLDISDQSLKIVQFKKKGDNIKIQAMGRMDLPKGLIESGEIKNKHEIVNLITELISKPKIGSIVSTDVVASLPDAKTFIKLIEVEKSPNNLNDVIPSEIERHVPMAIKDIYYDWEIIEETTDKYLILFGASAKNTVNQYLELLNDAGLSVVALEIESTAICRSLLAEQNPKNKNISPKNYAIIDIGSQRSSMIIYAKNSIVMSISMPISGEKISEKIAASLEIKYDQAEKAKIICGLDKTKAQGIIGEILSGMISDLNNRIKDALEFYNNHYADFGQINEIILCGGGANIKDIDLSISQFNSINTYRGNCFINLGENTDKILQNFSETHNLNSKILNNDKNENLAIKQDSSLTFSTAIGLALRNIFIS